VVSQTQNELLVTYPGVVVAAYLLEEPRKPTYQGWKKAVGGGAVLLVAAVVAWWSSTNS